MRLREFQEEREAVAALIDTVPFRLNSRNERFHDDINTLVFTYTTDLGTTSDIPPTVAAVRQGQESA